MSICLGRWRTDAGRLPEPAGATTNVIGGAKARIVHSGLHNSQSAGLSATTATQQQQQQQLQFEFAHLQRQSQLLTESRILFLSSLFLLPRTLDPLKPRNPVFKITLPCSGRVTDEVDVQVLINISGQPAELDALELADEPTSERLISYTLAIKRKKICTSQPIQVQPRTAPNFVVNRWPPEQPQVQPASQESAQQPTVSGKRLIIARSPTAQA